MAHGVSLSTLNCCSKRSCGLQHAELSDSQSMHSVSHLMTCPIEKQSSADLKLAAFELHCLAADDIPCVFLSSGCCPFVAAYDAADLPQHLSDIQTSAVLALLQLSAARCPLPA